VPAGWFPVSSTPLPGPCRLPSASSSNSSACCCSRWHRRQDSSSTGWEAASSTTAAAAGGCRAWGWHDGDGAGGCGRRNGRDTTWRGTVKRHVWVSLLLHAVVLRACDAREGKLAGAVYVSFVSCTVYGCFEWAVLMVQSCQHPCQHLWFAISRVELCQTPHATRGHVLLWQSGLTI
jgi:hypothetical protein